MFVAIIFPAQLFAETFCACCAEPGHYSIRTSKPADYQLKELQRLKFQTAELYTDAGYPDTVIGIGKPLGESFSVSGLLNGKSWVFNFRDNNRKTGNLNLMKPISMVEYMVDLPGENKETEVRLYKEWRFKYRVQSATGIFGGGFAPATEYFLVLQGYGNVCTAAEDFKKWRLEVTGKKSGFSFFGNVGAN